VEAVVEAAGFPLYTFVEAPFLLPEPARRDEPQPQPDGSKAWTLPLDPALRCIHVGDSSDLGNVVAGAFEKPDAVGRGQHLSFASALLSFDDIVATT
jgi:hypothetical protein